MTKYLSYFPELGFVLTNTRLVIEHKPIDDINIQFHLWEIFEKSYSKLLYKLSENKNYGESN